VRDFLRNGKLLTLMLGHLTVDSYVGVLPVFYPLLIGRFHLSLATVGLVSLAYGGTAAISQPLFGVIADRYGTRLTGVALGWTALTFSLAGFVPTFPLLLVLACASGLGSGAFHPLGALDVRALLPIRGRSTGMSIYVTAGTVGLALGPLIGIFVFGVLGIHGTILLVIPGIAGGAYLLWRMRGSAGAAAGRKALGAAGGAIPLVPVAVVIGVMMSRSWTVGVFQAFTPTWYRELGYGPAFYGPLATTLVLASAGLERLGRGSEGVPIPESSLVPAAGQGCLALEARTGDAKAADAAAAISDQTALTTLTAERAVVAALDASCHTPVGAHATPNGEKRLQLTGFVGMPDGSHWIRDELDADATDPAAAGREIAQRLLAAGAAELLAASERASLR